MSSVGTGGGRSGANQGRLMIRLKPRHDRELTADQVIRKLQPKLAQIPGVRTFLQVPPSIRVGGRQSKSQYQFTLQSTDIAALYDGARALEKRLHDETVLQDVTSDLQITNPEVRVQIDRDRASAVGVSARQIEEALYNAYGSRQVSTIFTPSDQYWVVLELLPQYQRNPEALSKLMVRGGNGQLVPLGAVASFTPGLGPLSVNHAGQIPAVTISFDLAPGAALGDGVAAVQRVARDVLPSDVTTNFAGTAQVFQSSQQGLFFLLLVALLVIYLVLGILYESFIHPLTILSGVPFAAFGALATLMLFGTELGVYAFVGVIMLIGLVKKNSIMMIDFALEAQRNEGKSARLSVWFSQSSAARNCSSVALSTSRPPGSSSASASSPRTTCSEVRLRVPASVSTSTPVENRKVATPILPPPLAPRAPSAFQWSRPAIIRWITRYSSSSSATTIRLPMRSTPRTCLPNASSSGGSAVRSRCGLVTRTSNSSAPMRRRSRCSR
jgi:HAE1 family hydrophobic/amphiphilic exporter-1